MKETAAMFAVKITTDPEGREFFLRSPGGVIYLAHERESAEAYCKGIVGAKVAPVTVTVEESV